MSIESVKVADNKMLIPSNILKKIYCPETTVIKVEITIKRVKTTDGYRKKNQQISSPDGFSITKKVKTSNIIIPITEGMQIIDP